MMSFASSPIKKKNKPPRYVSAFIYGGLGNQLFQIVVTIAMAIQQNRQFIFKYDRYVDPQHKRSSFWDTFLSSLKKYTLMPNEYQALLSEYEMRMLEIKSHHYVPFVLPENENIVLNGYFQSYKYFIHSFSSIKEIIGIEEKRKQIDSSLFTNQTWNCVMHFRLGDYLQLSSYHPVLSIDYYRRAIVHVLSCANTGGRPINMFYFVDHNDFALVEQNYISILKKEFPMLNWIYVSGLNDWEELLLMTFADGHIIANSTFSLWGVYLNPKLNMNIEKNDQLMVCYPSVWFGPALSGHDTKDMFFLDWCKIE